MDHPSRRIFSLMNCRSVSAARAREVSSGSPERSRSTSPELMMLVQSDSALLGEEVLAGLRELLEPVDGVLELGREFVGADLRRLREHADDVFERRGEERLSELVLLLEDVHPELSFQVDLLYRLLGEAPLLGVLADVC